MLVGDGPFLGKKLCAVSGYGRLRSGFRHLRRNCDHRHHPRCVRHRHLTKTARYGWRHRLRARCCPIAECCEAAPVTTEE